MPATFQDLIELMARLRSPEGCPWDREQTYDSLAPMLLEEAYEAVEAVESARESRPLELRDELGDLLFQIVFYAQVARERGDFAIEDVMEAIHSKMVRRHPHVFGHVQAADATAVLRNWEAIKAEERRTSAKERPSDGLSLLDGTSKRVPALMEAHQLSTKAARVGFDWRDLEEIFDKLREEVDELREAIADHSESQSEVSQMRLREEIGDVLFTVTNLARHLRVEPEAALKSANRKFRRRFHHIEQSIGSKGRTLETASLEEMESLWEQAKQEGTEQEPDEEQLRSGFLTRGAEEN